MTTRFWQLNCHKSKIAAWNLELKSKENTYPIMLLQETNLKGKVTTIRIPEYETIIGGERPRACILVPRALKYKHVKELSSRDVVAITLETRDRNILVISGYMDASIKQIDNTFYEAMAYANQNGMEVILGADANAQSTWWNNEKNNNRGDKLEDFILLHNLEVSNQGNKPTWGNIRCSSIIDVTLVSQGLRDNIKEWQVSDENMDSDHRLIEFKLDLVSQKKVIKARNFKKANWEKFRSLLNKHSFTSKHYWTEADVELEAKKLESQITDALNIVAPIKVIKFKNKDEIGHDPSIMDQSKKVKAAGKRYRKNPTMNNKEKLKEHRKKLKGLVKVYKNRKWQEFCETLNSPTDVAKFAKQGTEERIQINGIKNDEGSITYKEQEIIEILKQKHFGSTCKERSWTAEKDRKVDIYNNNSSVIKYITEDKVKEAINSFGSGKAAGPDQIKPTVLKNLPSCFMKRLTELYRASIGLGYIPKAWADSKVIFIPKQGKGNYSEAKAFRPITLMNFVFKSLEKLMLWKVRETTLKDNPMSQFQHGFRERMSTDTALSTVVDKIEQGILNKEITVGIFLDIKGAFDNIKIDFALTEMRLKGVDEDICKWYEKYLLNRNSAIELNGYQERFGINRGLPQGGNLSPIVYNMSIDRHLNGLNTEGVSTIAFADDTTLLATGKCISTICNILQRKIKVLESWSKAAGVEFNTDKSVVMMFTNKRKVKEIPIRLQGTNLDYVQETKYLGVTLTPKLSWNSHIRNKISSCKRQMYLVKRMVNNRFNMSMKALKWIYTACIRPKILYAAHIWGHSLSKKMIQELYKINSLGCRNIAPCWRSTPTKALEIIWNIEPLHLAAKEKGLSTYARTKDIVKTVWSGYANGKFGHWKHWEIAHKKSGIPTEIEHKINRRAWEKAYEVLPFRKHSGSLKDKINVMEYPNTLYIYSDGSKTEENQAGYGFVCRYKNRTVYSESGYIGKNKSVYQAELCGLKEAIKHLNEGFQAPEKIECRIDNQAVLRRLQSSTVNTSLELDCRNELNTLGQRNKIQLRWVKSHSQVIGNEAADTLAKDGANHRCDKEIKINFPKAYIKEMLWSNTKKEWSQEWISGKHTTFKMEDTKYWLPKVRHDLGKKMEKLNRTEASRVIGIISGHCAIGKHLARSKLLDEDKDPRICRLCNKELEDNKAESIQHWIEDCNKSIKARFRAFGTMLHAKIKEQWTVSNVSRFCREEGINRLFQEKEENYLTGETDSDSEAE